MGSSTPYSNQPRDPAMTILRLKEIMRKTLHTMASTSTTPQRHIKKLHAAMRALTLLPTKGGGMRRERESVADATQRLSNSRRLQVDCHLYVSKSN